MSVREKLVDLLTDRIPGIDNELRYVDDERVERLADYLIANGVTIQKWIPVSERLPDEEGWYLVFTTPNRGYRSINKGQFIKGYEWDNFKPRWRGAGGTWTNVTHWMPLPEPPKGE